MKDGASLQDLSLKQSFDSLVAALDAELAGGILPGTGNHPPTLT